MKVRKSALELPDVHEILKLIHERESPRLAGSPGWLDKNLDIFMHFGAMCKALKVDDFTKTYQKVHTEEELKDYVEHVESLKSMLLDALDKRNLDSTLAKAVYSQLGEVDDLERADAIFVYGAPSNIRVEHASRLYLQGLAPKLVISGKGPNWAKRHDQTEAERMAKQAIKLGVSKKDILLEPLSLTMADNVKRTLDLFDSKNVMPNKLIVVTSEFNMLRAYIQWHRFPERPIKILRAAPPVQDKDKSQDNWHTNVAGRNIVINEYSKIVFEACVESIFLNKKLDHIT